MINSLHTVFRIATEIALPLCLAAVFLSALTNDALAQASNYNEYHCYRGWGTTTKCAGDGSQYSVTHYLVNQNSKTVATDTESLVFLHRKAGDFYYRTADGHTEIWSECTIVDALNFICKRSSHRRFDFEVLELSNGKVTSCTYCVRFRTINFFEYIIMTSIKIMTSRYCSPYGADGPRCPED